MQPDEYAIDQILDLLASSSAADVALGLMLEQSQQLDLSDFWTKLKKIYKHIFKTRSKQKHLLTLWGAEELRWEAKELDSLPAEVAMLRNARQMILSSNRFTAFPRELLQLPQLRRLIFVLSKYEAHFDLPDDIDRLGDLEALYLSNVNNVPDSIGNLRHLRTLQFQHGNIEKLPESLGQLKQLHTFDIGHNPIESLPLGLFRLPILKDLRLADNRLEAIPAAIGNLSELERLYLNNNNLLSLPETMGNLTKMQHLYIGQNGLRQLPTSLANMHNLRFLSAGENLLKSIDKDFFAHLPLLQYVDFANNKLSEIPDKIVTCKQLSTLRLDRNQISELPKDIGRLTNLNYLDLSQNQLKEIPKALHLLPRLYHLKLHGNPIQKIPNWLYGMQQLSILSLSLSPHISQQDIDRLQKALSMCRIEIQP